MQKNLVFELGADVAQTLRELTESYGESSPAATISRALGLMKMLEPYIHNGILTVIDPDPNVSDVDREVDLLFEGKAKQIFSLAPMHAVLQ